MTEQIRAELAQRIASSLPKFGLWASSFRETDTPYGRVGPRQAGILWVLRYELIPANDVSPSKLASYFQVQPSVMTGALAKLEAAGFVTRTVDPDDSRITRVAITDQGRQVIEYVEEFYDNEILEGLVDLDDWQIEELSRSVELLTRLVDELLNRRLSRLPGRNRHK